MKIRLSLWMLLLVGAVTASGCAMSPTKSHNLPPAQQMLEPGPGVGGPGPGVLPPMMPSLGMGMVPQQTVQILFSHPESMQVRWDVSGNRQFDSVPLIVPGRNNFPENGIYQLKITNISGREGTELYPTLEIGARSHRTAAFLAHNAIPVQFTEDDLDQVAVGNYVTKVIYLPDPDFQGLAEANVDTLVSTRLEPGMDPVVEADRRGSIMAIVRLGNVDLETPGGMQGNVVPAGYAAGGAPMAGVPMGAPGMAPVMMAPSGLMPNYVSGVTAPSYGMPITGTPIGLPGPPHIPLGGGAGLRKHVITNHTHMHMPGPTRSMKIHVRQQPGYSYPKPPSRVYIREQNIQPALPYGQPRSNTKQLVK